MASGYAEMGLQLCYGLDSADSQQIDYLQALFGNEAASNLYENIDISTVSPIDTLLDPYAEEKLRCASIQIGIGAGVLNPGDGTRNEYGDGAFSSPESKANVMFGCGTPSIDYRCRKNIGDVSCPSKTNDICSNDVNSNYLLLPCNADAENSRRVQLEIVEDPCLLQPLEPTNADVLSVFADSEPNIIREPNDMYTPRWIRGIGKEKEGLCPACFANGQLTWKRMKCSAFWYHLNYYHGICALTGRPFPPPVETRSISSLSNRKRQQGKCHICEKWVYLDSSRRVNINVPDIFWWKHIQVCIKQTWAQQGHTF